MTNDRSLATFCMWNGWAWLDLMLETLWSFVCREISVCSHYANYVFNFCHCFNCESQRPRKSTSTARNKLRDIPCVHKTAQCDAERVWWSSPWYCSLKVAWKVFSLYAGHTCDEEEEAHRNMTSAKALQNAAPIRTDGCLIHLHRQTALEVIHACITRTRPDSCTYDLINLHRWAALDLTYACMAWFMHIWPNFPAKTICNSQY